MKTKNSSPARNVVLAALFLALAFVLPMVTGHLPQVGNMLCPMHFPILLCGFVLGGGVSMAGEYLLDAVREAVRPLVFFKTLPYPSIQLAQLGADAGIIGAAAL